MAAAGVVLLSSAGSGGLRQQAWGLIQEAWAGQPARAGPPATPVPGIPLGSSSGPGVASSQEDNRRPSSIRGQQESPSGPRRFLVDPPRRATGGCLDLRRGWLPVPGTLPGSAFRTRTGQSQHWGQVCPGGWPLPWAPAPPNHVTVAWVKGSCSHPPSAGWGKGDMGFRSSPRGPGRYRGL